ncbi:MAG: dipeptidase [Phycisphaerae bacterium]|nr:MAG: dipeptidase [Phycisphaerae bacterium]
MSIHTRFLRSASLAILFAIGAAPLLAETPSRQSHGADAERKPIVVSDEARRIHDAGILIDGHNDLPWQLRKRSRNKTGPVDMRVHQESLQTDIPRLKKGGLDAQFWVVYIPADTPQDGTAMREAIEQFEVIEKMIKDYPDVFERALSAADIVRIHGQGKIASMIGVEGGHMIENSLEILSLFYDRGARYMGLTHSDSLDWADSATDDPKSHGLSKFGKSVVLEMNRLGMLVDLAHVSHETMRDALKTTKAPLIFSHSSAYAIAPHMRNVPDDVLKMVKANNGVVMVNFYSGYVDPEGARIVSKMFEIERDLKAKHPDKKEYRAAWNKWKAEHPIPDGTVHTLVDHIDHIVKVAGINHVGIGSDYDGVGQLPKQLEDVSCFPNITQELLNRGYKESDIHKIMGGNLLRVFREVELTAAKLQSTKPKG